MPLRTLYQQQNKTQVAMRNRTPLGSGSRIGEGRTLVPVLCAGGPIVACGIRGHCRSEGGAVPFDRVP